jgi:putative sterol carrier protein
MRFILSVQVTRLRCSPKEGFASLAVGDIVSRHHDYLPKTGKRLKFFTTYSIGEEYLKMGRVTEGYKDLTKRMNEVAEAKSTMTGWNKVVQFAVAGEGDFYIKFENGAATFHEGKHEKPDVTLKGPEEVFYKMLTRELDQTRAYFAKQYTIEGSMADAMKYGRIGTAVAKAT